MGTLKDKSLYRLRLHEDRLLFAERIPLGERIRYVEVVNGRLAVWMDNASLVWIKPSGLDRYKQYLANYLDEAELPGERRDRLESAISGCRECHSLGLGSMEDLPGLAGLAGSGIGRAAASSGALKNRVGKWSAANLSDYIASPQNFAPGTLMPDPGISDRESIDDLVRFLEALKTLKPLH